MKAFKKMLSLLLAIVMVVGLAPVTAFAEPNVAFTATANKESLEVGDEIEVTVSMGGAAEGVMGLQFEVTYDNSALEYKSLSTTHASFSEEDFGAKSPGKITGLFEDGTTKGVTLAGGDIVKIVFTAKAAAESSAIGLTIVEFYDAQYEDIGKTASGASVTITPAPVPASKVEITEGDEATVALNRELTLHATVEPQNTTDAIVWSSGNTKVAEIDAGTGVVTPKAVGEAVITATAGEKSDTLTLNVTAAVADIQVKVGVYDYAAKTAGLTGASGTGVVLDSATATVTVPATATAYDAFIKAMTGNNIAYGETETAYGKYISSINSLAEKAGGHDGAGWLFSINDSFSNRGASSTSLKAGDRLEWHYSLGEMGGDIGSFWAPYVPTITEFKLGGVTRTLSVHVNSYADYKTTFADDIEYRIDGVKLEGTGVAESPFVIPIELPKTTALTALKAELTTGLHEKYWSLAQGEGLLDVTETQDYSGDVTFALQTRGGALKTYYKVTVTRGNAAPTLAQGVTSPASVEFAAVDGAYKPEITKKFTDADGDALTYYYRVKQDEGDFGQWENMGEQVMFSGPAYFEMAQALPGTYTYEFKANDGTEDSKEVYTVVATVFDPAKKEYDVTIKVYPGTASIELYATTDFDSEGRDTFDSAAPITLADGGVVGGYHVYTVKLLRGTYSFRGTADGQSLGGMTFSVPAKGASGSSFEVVLRQQNFSTSTKLDGESYATAEQYYARATDSNGRLATMGSASVNQNGITIYSALLHAAGNTGLYTYEFGPSGDYVNSYGKVYIFNRALFASQYIDTVSGTLPALGDYSITVPEGATARVFSQIRNFYAQEYKASGEPVVKDGQATWSFRLPSSGSFTYRVSKAGETTKAGYFSPSGGSMTVDFSDVANGTAMENRAENSVLLNINKDNFLTLGQDESFRLRAYRAAWQIIDSDTSNIMIEPDFHYNVISGSDVIEIAAVTEGNGNATGNWLDITAKKSGTAVIEITYDAINIVGSSSHGGHYESTDAYRKGLVVVQVGGAATVNWGVVAVGSDGIWDSELDTVYYDSEKAGSGSFSFKPVADETISEVFCGATRLSADAGGAYTAQIGPGGNLLKLTTASGGVAYKLVRGAPLTLSVKKTAGDPSMKSVGVGDTIVLSFEGLYAPVPKFSGIYNPGFGNTQKLTYYIKGEKIQGQGAQYDFINNHAITLKVTEEMLEDSKLCLTGGSIPLTVMGASDMFTGGGHRGLTDAGVGANFSAVAVPGEFCVLPDLELEVAARITYDITLAGLPEDAAITLKNSEGAAVEANKDNKMLFEKLPYGEYSYEITAAGKKMLRGGFTASEAEGEGTRTITLIMEALAQGGWDGVTFTEPAKVSAEEAGTVGGDFEGQEGYYKISMGAELAWLAAHVNKGNAVSNAVLAANIDLSGFGWTPIGADPGEYSGVFDGNGKSITGLYINSGEGKPCVAMFSYTSKATIKDFTLEGKITNNGGYTASVVAYMMGGTLEGVVSNVDITINKSVRGAFPTYTGGVAASVIGGAVKSCKFGGTLTNGYQYVGGIAAEANSGAVIEGCSNSAAISGHSSIGGIVGQTSAATVTACSNSGSVSATYNANSNAAGGIVGAALNGSAIKDCANSGTVSASVGNAGGVAGRLSSQSATVYPVVERCYNTGAVSGGAGNIGGVVGHSYGGQALNCYNRGTVSGNGSRAAVGGVVGASLTNTSTAASAKTENVYNSGAVSATGSGAAGALVGDDLGTGSNATPAPIASAYYLEDTAARAIGDIPEPEKYEGYIAKMASKTDAEMKEEAFVALLGFAFKKTLGDYPALKNSGEIDENDRVAAPVISGVALSTTEPINGSVTVTVTATDNYRVAGYSFDGGKSWQAEGSKTFTENATNIVIQVKDPAGNITEHSASINITNIDKTAPVISGVALSTTEPTNGDVTLTVTATDANAMEYSFDGGTSWQAGNTKVCSANGDIEAQAIQVKDAAGNVAKYSEKITIANIDKTAPEITRAQFAQTPNEREKGSVTVAATDAVALVSVKLACVEAGYDETKTAAPFVFDVAKAGNYTVTATDTAGNTATEAVTVAFVAMDSISIAAKESSTELEDGVLNFSLAKGETKDFALKAVFNPAGAESIYDASWSSGKQAVATVDENGVVTAKATGLAVIKVSVGGLSASVLVQVLEQGVSTVNTGRELNSIVQELLPDPAQGKLSAEQKAQLTAVLEAVQELPEAQKRELGDELVEKLDALLAKDGAYGDIGVKVVTSVDEKKVPQAKRIPAPSEKTGAVGLVAASGANSGKKPGAIALNIKQTAPERGMEYTLEIGFEVDGVEAKLVTPVLVTVEMPEGYEHNGKWQLKHTKRDGTAEWLNFTYDKGENTITFRVESLSPFSIGLKQAESAAGSKVVSERSTRKDGASPFPATRVESVPAGAEINPNTGLSTGLSMAPLLVLIVALFAAVGK